MAFAAVHAVKAFRARHAQNSGHRLAVRRQTRGDFVRAQLVDQLERAPFPVVAQLHRVIDGEHVVGDLARQRRGIGQGRAQNRPGIGALFAGQRQNAGQIGGQFGRRCLCAVIACGEVDGFLALAHVAVEAVESALALAPGIALGDHFGDERVVDGDGVIGVVRRQGAGQAGL